MKKQEAKRLKPSERPKKRYIKFSASGLEEVNAERIQQMLWNALVEREGREKAKDFYIKVVEFRDGKGIARCALEKAERLREFLPGITELGGKKVRIKTIKTSGTLKKLRGHGSHRKKILGN